MGAGVQLLPLSMSTPALPYGRHKRLSGINNTINQAPRQVVYGVPSNAAVADVGTGSGICNRHLSNGEATITYTIGSGCVATANITVNPFAANSGTRIPVWVLLPHLPFCEWLVEQQQSHGCRYRRRDGYCSGLSREHQLSLIHLLPDVMHTTVNVIALSPITGAASVCVGQTTALSNAALVAHGAVAIPPWLRLT